MKRRIVRSFFIGLLLLYVGQWCWSWDCCQIVRYGGHNIWGVESSWGEIHLGWESNTVGVQGWERHTAINQDDNYPSFEQFGQIQIPFWFPLTIPPAMLLWWAWRETRPKRIAPGCCLKCGYDLRASEGSCPECGSPIPAAERRL